MQTIIREEDLNAFNEEISKKVAAHNAELAEANKRPPTNDDLNNEFCQLRSTYTQLCFDAKQAEGSVNRAANRVKYFENRLKLLKGTIPTEEYGRLLAKFTDGERVYRYAETFRCLSHAEEDLTSSIDFFDRMKRIGTVAALRLKEFEKHQLARLEELKKIVAKNDADYSFIHGTARSKGWGRW
jgi:hypothetical protein